MRSLPDVKFGAVADSSTVLFFCPWRIFDQMKCKVAIRLYPNRSNSMSPNSGHWGIKSPKVKIYQLRIFLLNSDLGGLVSLLLSFYWFMINSFWSHPSVPLFGPRVGCGVYLRHVFSSCAMIVRVSITKHPSLPFFVQFERGIVPSVSSFIFFCPSLHPKTNNRNPHPCPLSGVVGSIKSK